MFTPDHQIWQYAYLHDRLNDCLPFAEDLVETWSNCGADEVEFRSTWEIILASLMLMDDLLPPPARMAMARLTLQTISEVEEKKLGIDCLNISPPKPGRQEDRRLKGQILFAVRDLIKSGYSKTDAYNEVSQRYFKSPDTVRRMYERAIKRSEQALKQRAMRDPGK